MILILGKSIYFTIRINITHYFNNYRKKIETNWNTFLVKLSVILEKSKLKILKVVDLVIPTYKIQAYVAKSIEVGLKNTKTPSKKKILVHISNSKE